MFKFLIITFLVTTNAFSASLDPRYFANQSVQSLSPKAFALQPEAKRFLLANKEIAQKEKNSLINAIKKDESLFERVKNFPSLSWEKKEEVLREVFALEVLTLNIKAPELIIDSNRIKGESYFDFDNAHPDTGIVVLNPKEIAKDPSPYAALMLLIHETKHSAQFQKAFDPAYAKNARAQGFKAAFLAQKELSKQITSFSDFLTLLNEYEAFDYGNFVVGALTNWTVDTLGMGTLASQYNADQTLKMDLYDIVKKFEKGEIQDSVLDEFNRLEKVQYDLLKAQ